MNPDKTFPRKSYQSKNYQGLIWKIRAASDIGQKGHFFEKKKGTKNFTTPYSVYFLSVLDQKKTSHNFQKKAQCPTAGCIKGLD